MKKLYTSVAMATYNGEKYIKEQLDSIINQTKKVDEIVVSDDCSIDNTLKIVDEYRKTYNEINWIVLSNPSNLGYSKNFKNAISKCSGDIIFLCDQDDVWIDEKVSLVSSLFENNDSVMSVLSDFKTIDECGNYIKEFEENENIWLKKSVTFSSVELYNIQLDEILGHNWGPGCTQAIRKTLVDSYLKIRSNMVHDWELNILAAFNGGCYYYKKVLTLYRIHSNNSIGMSTSIFVRKRKGLLNSLFDFLRAVKFCVICSHTLNNFECYHITNLPIETLEMIEEFMMPQTKEICEKLERYKNFFADYSYSLINKKLMKYLICRIKFKDCFKNQVHIQYTNEWNYKLMSDLKTIISKK